MPCNPISPVYQLYPFKLPDNLTIRFKMKLVYVISILLLFSSLHASDAQSICRGQDFTLDHSNVSLILSQLQQYFSNCEYIYDNLEIIFPQLTDIPGQFSDVFISIREIQGYLLLENIRTDTLNMSNLLIIRGQSNFTVNNTPNALVLKNTQINTLLLTNLKEITNFGVTVYNENQNISSACNLHGVNWADILNTGSVFLSPNCTSQSCGACTPPYCWTETDCQMLTLINCTCNGGRCVTNNPAECCDVSLCSAGCTSSTACNACSGCRRFDAGISTCIQQSSCIPSSLIRGYPFLTPRFLSATCNAPLIVETQGLVQVCSRQCGESNANVLCINGAGTNSLQCRVCQSAQGEGRCIPYPTSLTELPALNVPSIPKSTCPTISTINSIVLDQGSFDPINPITPSFLNVFRDLTLITDYLVIRDFPSFYGDAFTFLSRLTRIGGNTLYMGRYSLYITNNAFRQIDLRSLSSIEIGDVLIENNTNLCYLPTVSGFTKLMADMPQVQISSCPCHSLCESSMGCWGPSNAQCIECSVVEINDICETNCESMPNTYISSKRCAQCDALCINCTGSATNCTECTNVSLSNGECVSSCPSTTFINGSQCIDCNENCKMNEVNGPICSGPTDNFGLAFNGCSECRIYQPQNNTLSNYTCVSMCDNGFADGTLTPGPVCRPCDPACTRCTGGTVQDCDTNACSLFIDEERSECVLNCSNVTHYVSPPRTCRPCDPICSGCTGGSSSDCLNCLGSMRGDECVSNCPSSEFTNSTQHCEACNDLCGSCIGTRDNCITCRLAMIIRNGTRTCLNECPPGYYRATNLTCLLCNVECFNCSGALDTDCVGRCRNFQLLPADQCVSTCPDIAEVNNVTRTCTIISSSLNAGVIAGISVGGAILVLIVIGVIVMIIVGSVYSKKYKKKKDNLEQGTLLHLREKGNIQRTIEGLPEFTLLGFNYETLAEATPSVFPLHVVNKSALEVRKLLGRGFYGNVYAGHYSEHSQDGFPVAIKTLNQNGLKGNSENELAIAMQDISTLMHPSFVQIFGYNSSINYPFIVTQLLIGPSLYNLFSRYPGCIDEDKIFKYIVQIGDGMMYLEKQGFVYGLVTARNVILENHDNIKLTDFFLYRFSNPIPENALDLPIQERWMSPELALNHNPTNKSDVWGFGVLFWELLSFVQLPYGKVPDNAVVGVLQQGQRLPQPTACSVDLYGYLLQCFLFEPSGRPTFEKLQTELVEMSKLPQKYISIQLDKLDSTMQNRLEYARIPKDTTLVIGNPSTGHGTLTQQDITTEELGLGEYVDEQVVNKLMDSESQLNQQDKTIEELRLGEYVDEEQVNKLMDVESIDQLITNSGEYNEVNQASSGGDAIENEYAEVDMIPNREPGIDSMQESELPKFVSIHDTKRETHNIPNSNNPISSLDVSPTDDTSLYEQPTVFISPNATLFSPYETFGKQNADN